MSIFGESAEVLSLPHLYDPREYQKPVFDAMFNKGFKRAVAVWHRRTGKDKTFWNIMIAKSFQRVGVYYYFFPTFEQARKAIWNAIDNDGVAFLSHIPDEALRSMNDQQMLLRLNNGSIIQFIGTDDVDRIMGTNPVGVVFSEYSLQHPVAWEMVRPILALNNGWAVFNFTPRGKNHAEKLYTMAKTREDWFVQTLTADDTAPELLKAGYDLKAIIEKERQEGMPEELIQQEYYCSFNAGVQGAYYSRLIDVAEVENRITDVPYNAAYQVGTAWDIGFDTTAIWFYQLLGTKIHVIDYYENRNEGLEHYIAKLKEKPYIYGVHIAPHDIRQRVWAGGEGGKNRMAIARQLGVQFHDAPKPGSKDDVINAVRMVIGRCWFDEAKCSIGLSALKSYTQKFNKQNLTWTGEPEHNWASHGSDAFGVFATTARLDEPARRVPDLHKPHGEWDTPMRGAQQSTDDFFGFGNDGLTF